MDKYMKLKDIPKGQRWEHFWTYYKVQTIIGAFVVLLVAMLVKDVVFKEKVDIYLTVASSEYASDAVSAELSRVLQQYGEDFDGNGDLSVYVDQITMSTESYTVDPEMVMAAQTRLIAQFQDKNQIIFLMDQDIYDSEIQWGGDDLSAAVSSIYRPSMHGYQPMNFPALADRAEFPDKE